MKMTKHLNLYLFFLLSILPIFFYSSRDLINFIQKFQCRSLYTLSIIFQYVATFYTYSFFLLILFILNVSTRKILFAFFSYFLASVIVQVLKRFVFLDYLRPHVIFGLSHNFSNVEHNMSLPSGHTATMFTFVSVISILYFSKDYFFQFILLLVAFFLSLSRLYLYMHFYRDVYVGALIGCFATQLVMKIIFINMQSISKLDMPIFSFLRLIIDKFL